MLQQISARKSHAERTFTDLQDTVNVPMFLTKWHVQTMQMRIRLLLQEQSDQGLHCHSTNHFKKTIFKSVKSKI